MNKGLFSRWASILIVFHIAGCGPAPGDRTLVWDASTGRPLETDDAMRTHLQGHRDDLAFDDAKNEAVFTRLRELYDVNIDVNWGALKAASIEPDQRLTLHLRQVSLAEALDRILAHVGGGAEKLAYQTTANVIVVSSAEDFARETSLRIYDVTDILSHRLSTRILEEPLKGTCLATSRQSGLGEPVKQPQAEKQPSQVNKVLDGPDGLINLITLNIEPCTWMTNGGNVGTIRSNGNLLIIKQTARAHEQIEAFLSTMRNAINPPPPEAAEVHE